MSSSSVPPEIPSLRRRLPSTGSLRVRFPVFFGTTRRLRLLLILPATLRCLRASGTSIDFVLRSVAVAMPQLLGLDYLLNAARRVTHRGDHENSQVPVELLPACLALRPRRTSHTSPSRCARYCLPLRKPRRLRTLFPFEAQSLRPAAHLCTLRS